MTRIREVQPEVADPMTYASRAQSVVGAAYRRRAGPAQYRLVGASNPMMSTTTTAPMIDQTIGKV